MKVDICNICPFFEFPGLAYGKNYKKVCYVNPRDELFVL